VDVLTTAVSHATCSVARQQEQRTRIERRRGIISGLRQTKNIDAHTVNIIGMAHLIITTIQVNLLIAILENIATYLIAYVLYVIKHTRIKESKVE
jgi:hypothetical protein